MSDYISRDAAYPLAKKVVDAIASGNYHPGVFGYDILDWIDDIPEADVRPVVLCRDCIHYKPQQKSARWSSTTPMCSRSATIKMPPDGFCSFGEKREES